MAVTLVTTGIGLTGGPITASGNIDLLPPIGGNIGGVKQGANVYIAPDGTINVAPPNPGTITGVYAGGGLLGGGTAGNVSLYVNFASSAEVIAGSVNFKPIAPDTLATKIGTLTSSGFVQLSDNPLVPDSTRAATPTAVKTVYDIASAALPKSGGTMTGAITFAPSQTFPGVALPKATTTSLGVIQVGSGLYVSPSGILSTVNNGTVTSVIAGPGLGAPASGNIISTSGTIRLLPPTTDGIQLGGVKAGDNVSIAFDGTISVPGSNFIATNNPYSYNSYIWPIPNAPGPGPIPLLPCPGSNGQVLSIVDNVTGTLGWRSSGTLSSVVAGTGLTVSSTPSTATLSLATVPTVVAGNYGATAQIPTFAVNAYGQITSGGLANPYSPYANATISAPPVLVLDFSGNNLFWKWTLDQNTFIDAPSNSQSGQTGALLLTQDPSTAYSVTWASNWKWANFTPYSGNPSPSGVDLIQFTVVSPSYIVVTGVIPNLG